MSSITPYQAAGLAQRVYQVKRERDIGLALAEVGIDSVARKDIQKVLKAETGGYLIRKRDAFAMSVLMKKGSQHELILVFRGTFFERMEDLMTNAQTGVRVSHTGKRVHVGFDRVMESLRRSLIEIILNVYKLDARGIVNIHCVGHSLGGAVATLAADYIRSTFTTRRVSLYTFGSPRVGVEDFARSFTRKLAKENQHRVFHETDPVPMIPIFPFVHTPLPGLGHHMESKAYPLISAHEMENYIHSVGDQSWEKLTRHAPTFDRPEMLKHWIKSTKPFLLTDAIGASRINNAIAMVLSHAIEKQIVKWNTRLYVGSTLVDTLARSFHQGITQEDVKHDCSMLMEILIRKIAGALGIKIKEGIKALTIGLLKYIFASLVARLKDLVRKSLSHMQSAF